MNRERLKYRKFLREISWIVTGVGFILVMFDWLIWRLMFPEGAWWLRIAGGIVGLALIWVAGRILSHAKIVGSHKSR